MADAPAISKRQAKKLKKEARAAELIAKNNKTQDKVEAPTTALAEITKAHTSKSKKAASAKSKVPVEKADLPANTLDKPKKTEPTQVRLSMMMKDDLKAVNLGIYVTLGKLIRLGTKLQAFHRIQRWLTNFNLTGLETLIKSAGSYYAVVFDTTINRDNALKYLNQEVYKYEDKPVQLTIEAFGVQAQEGNVIWLIQAGPLDTYTTVTTAVEMHIQQNYPNGYTCTIKVFPKLENGIKTGNWAVEFDKAPEPTAFKKQLKTNNGDHWYISQEPASICRFCRSPGHTIVQCKEGAYKSVAKGFYGMDIEVITDEAMSEAGSGSDMENEDRTMKL